MKTIVVTDQAAGTAGMKLMERPKPQDGRALSGAHYGDVVVQVRASGFTGDVMAYRAGFPVALLSVTSSSERPSGIVCDWKGQRDSFHNDAKLLGRP